VKCDAGRDEGRATICGSGGGAGPQLAGLGGGFATSLLLRSVTAGVVIATLNDGGGAISSPGGGGMSAYPSGGGINSGSEAAGLEDREDSASEAAYGGGVG
jgi:hypothetical protein